MPAAPKMSLAMLFMLGTSFQVAWANCPDDPEVDLCDLAETESSGAVRLHASTNPLVLMLAAALQVNGAKTPALAALLLPLADVLPKATATTCGALKTFYKDQSCCGSPNTDVTLPVSMAPNCPYNFAKPACADAEPQSPRDLTDGAVGIKIPKAATLTEEQGNFLPLTNVHWHLGAEHKAENYSDTTDSDAYDHAHDDDHDGHDHRRLSADPRPGFMCTKSDLSQQQLAAYNFTYCKGDIAVGKSYEVHYVHSSAGYSQADLQNADLDGIEDGLGGAANGRGQLNPMIVVQGQVFQVVQGGETVNDMLHGWTVVAHPHSVKYMGSTTGPSHNNEVCSPYAVTWHVDKACHRVSPESFDNLCKQLKETYNLEADLYPHGSRKIVDSAYVVKPEYVTPLTSD